MIADFYVPGNNPMIIKKLCRFFRHSFFYELSIYMK